MTILNRPKRFINSKFLYRLIFVCVVLALSVLGTRIILEKLLVRNALELEADYFIAAYQENPDFPLPHTRNLIGYLGSETSEQGVPDFLKRLPPGLHTNIYYNASHPKIPVFVREFEAQRLYLVFLQGNVDRLVGVFGILPITILLIIAYLSSWLAYHRTWGAISPVLRLAKKVRGLDPEHAQPLFDAELPNLKGEVADLAEALQDYSQRIDSLINRERQFTSDASHELRTPVTIIDGAVQIMLADSSIQGKSRERLMMIRRAAGDLSELIRVFFLLARENELNSDNNVYLLSEMVPVEVDKLRPLLEGGQVTLDYLEQGQWETTVPKQVVSIILNNLVRNAINYTEKGSVTVILNHGEIIVQDTGKGVDPDLLRNIFERHVRGRGNSKAGEGLGMAIVKRLVDQFHLELNITNLQPNGLKVVLREAENKTN